MGVLYNKYLRQKQAEAVLTGSGFTVIESVQASASVIAELQSEVIELQAKIDAVEVPPYDELLAFYNRANGVDVLENEKSKLEEIIVELSG